MTDLFLQIPLFHLEIEGNYKRVQIGAFLFFLCRDSTLKISLWLNYGILFLINILFLITAEKNVYGWLSPAYTSVYTIICILALIICVISTILLVVYMIFKLNEEFSKEMIKIEKRFRDQSKFWYFIRTTMGLVKLSLTNNYLQSFIIHDFLCIYGLIHMTRDDDTQNYSSGLLWAIQLLLIFNISETAQFVLKALYLKGSQLLMTFFLALILIYIFTIMIAEWLSDDWSDSIFNCNTVRNCFGYVFNNGLRNGGGISDSFNYADSKNDSGHFVARLIFDPTFFILINFIC